MADVSLTIVLEGLAQVKSQLDSIGTTMKKVGTDLTAAGRSLTLGVTAPILALGGAAVKSGADFQKAMTESMAIMGDLSDSTKRDMTEAARVMATTTKFSATQAAESYFYLASAGLDAKQSIAALPTVAQFAQAGNFDMARATDLLTDAQSALGLTIRDDVVKNMKNMLALSDVLVKANTLANATVQQFSESLTNRAGAALKQVNKSMEEGVAVLAAFADQGIKGQVAGQALFMVLRDLQSATIKNRSEFDKMGITVYDSNGKLANMADIMGDLEGALGGLSDEQKKMALAQLGFTDRSQAFLLTLLGTSDAIRKYQKGLEDAGGVTKEVADKQIQNFWDQLGLLKDKLVDVGIELSTVLIPVLTDFKDNNLDPTVKKLMDMVKAFVELDSETQKAYIKWTALAAVLGPSLIILGALFTSIGSIATAFAWLITPAGLTTAAIAGLVVASILLYKHWDEVSSYWIKIWNDIGRITEIAIAEILKGLLSMESSFEGMLLKIASLIPEKFRPAFVGEWIQTLEESRKGTDEKIKLIEDRIYNLNDQIIGVRDTYKSTTQEVINGMDEWIEKQKEVNSYTEDQLKVLQTAASKGLLDTPLVPPPPDPKSTEKVIKDLEVILKKKELLSQFDSEYFITYSELLKKQGVDSELIQLLIAKAATERYEKMMHLENQFQDYTKEGMLKIVKQQNFANVDIMKLMEALGQRYQKESQKNTDVWQEGNDTQIKATETFKSVAETAVRGLASTMKSLWHGNTTTFKDAWMNALDTFVDVMAQMAVKAIATGAEISVAMASATAGVSLFLGLLGAVLGGGGGPSKLDIARKELKYNL